MKKSVFLVHLFVLIALCYCPFLEAQQQHTDIIPEPVSVTYGNGEFEIKKNTKIYVDKEGYPSALFLAELLRKSTGYKMPVVELKDSSQEQEGITFYATTDTGLGDEGYVLDISQKRIIVKAPKAAGLFYGVQSIRQLLPPTVERNKTVKNQRWTLPVLKVTDEPRFGWRGYMKDVSRTFYSVDVVKKYLDLMALYKLNTFHFHLTDDQGWRIEIKRYPELTSKKATVFGDKHDVAAERSGFYTQEEIKDIVAYAAERNITIVPEIDVPGHCWPVILVYPELGVNNVREPDYLIPFMASWGYWGFQFTPNPLDPTKEVVYEFLDNVFTEVAGLFPGEYLHFGGDEVVHRLWESEPHVQAFMKEKGFEKVEELQSYFVNRVCKMIQQKGKKPIGWNDILKGNGLTKETAIMSWLGSQSIKEASGKGYYNVATPSSHLYFDITQRDRSDGTVSDLNYGNINSIERVYQYDPTGDLPDNQKKYVLGVQANMWPAVAHEVKDINVQNFPRLLALSEIAWTQPEKKNLDNFKSRLSMHYPRLDELKVDYFREGGYITGTWTPADITTDYKMLEWNVTNKVYTNGRITAGLFYTKGKSFLNIKKMQLLENGKVISEDIHDGLADKFRGTHATKTYLYNLKVDNYNPKATYTIRAEVAGKDGTDSYGNFTFNLSPYIPFAVTEPH